MVLDNERCRVTGCTLHRATKRTTSISDRNRQVREDWDSGEWSVEELSCFWGLKPLSIKGIIGKAGLARAGAPSLEVSGGR